MQVRALPTEFYGTLPALRENQDGPLLPSFDQWGHFAAVRRDRRGLSGRAVAAIVAAHLTGAASSRHTRSESLDPRPTAREAKAEEFSPSRGDGFEVGIEGVELTPDELNEQYEAAIARKYADVRALGDLDDAFEEIDRKAEAILGRTEELLAQLGLS